MNDYPRTNNLLIAAEILIIQKNDDAEYRFMNNAAAYVNWTNEQLHDALEVYSRPIKRSLERIVNLAKTTKCASGKWAEERLAAMKEESRVPQSP